MMEANKGDLNLNYILYGYPEFDFEGGFLNYKTMLIQNVNDHKCLNIVWLSDYNQILKPYIFGERLNYLFDRKETARYVDKSVELFGEDWDECDQQLTIEQTNLIKEEAKEQCFYEIAEKMCKKMLNEMQDNHYDNKYYGGIGNCSNEKRKKPIDKGLFMVVDAQGKELLTCVYEENLPLEQNICYDLIWYFNVRIPLSKIKTAIEEAKKTDQNILIFDGKTACNDEDAECSLDYITIYLTPDGKIHEKRIHSY